MQTHDTLVDDAGPEDAVPDDAPVEEAVPDDVPDDVVASPLALLMLARARRRAVLPLDVVTFVAACPACGRDCEWTQIRQETRVRSQQDCPCG